ncbi:GlsB/YeaQ/YmgE family stress response membrane protein [Asticcacaulis sp. BYS171W]|uniref:GlsB/YeaQ/YmgE family stress response membrane protein n=1 Tax=Asticcacaulis aquaticus TaxID=2984212 RepID=A0ABT5HW05_9CAUL|nr:GlsB/YeaQ/YmgE family stress response membrane protein [Asticcacaulis aquaticus]MDC7684113.1 GlsB/YeaQ/YmgE family stress response membrane protein [Asticcacaulis aquaticus]
MQDNQIGWLAALIVGAFAGWIAEQLMKSEQGLFMNIILGIIGAAVASFLFSIIGVSFGGWIGYLIAGVIGACLLIGAGRMFRGRRHS